MTIELHIKQLEAAIKNTKQQLQFCDKRSEEFLKGMLVAYKISLGNIKKDLQK